MIHFHTEDIAFVLKNKTLLRKWITETIEGKKRKVGDINFIFCSDSYLLSINKQYLKHDTYTDIITFDYSKEATTIPISGDIFISIDRIKENAKKFSKTTEEELRRVIIHGILHLLGYADKTKVAKEEMTKQENKYLKKWVLVLFGLSLTLFSCKESKPLLDTLPGKYTYNTKIISENIQINKDGTFSYIRKGGEITIGCNGKWQYLKNDSIRLSYDVLSKRIVSEFSVIL